MKKILPFFSYLFHPLFVPIFALVFYYALQTDRYFSYDEIYIHLIQVLVITVFIPLMVFYLLLINRRIDSIMVADVGQRKIPLFLHIVLLLLLLSKTTTKGSFPELYYFFLGSVVSSGFALLFTFFNKKVSLHMLGITSLSVFVISLSYHFNYHSLVLGTMILLCSGLVGSSRLVMKAHNPIELIMGTIIGISPQLYLLLFWL